MSNVIGGIEEYVKYNKFNAVKPKNDGSCMRKRVKGGFTYRQRCS